MQLATVVFLITSVSDRCFSGINNLRMHDMNTWFPSLVDGINRDPSKSFRECLSAFEACFFLHSNDQRTFLIELDIVSPIGYWTSGSRSDRSTILPDSTSFSLVLIQEKCSSHSHGVQLQVQLFVSLLRSQIRSISKIEEP